MKNSVRDFWSGRSDWPLRDPSDSLFLGRAIIALGKDIKAEDARRGVTVDDQGYGIPIVEARKQILGWLGDGTLPFCLRRRTGTQGQGDRTVWFGQDAMAYATSGTVPGPNNGYFATPSLWVDVQADAFEKLSRSFITDRLRSTEAAKLPAAKNRALLEWINLDLTWDLMEARADLCGLVRKKGRVAPAAAERIFVAMWRDATGEAANPSTVETYVKDLYAARSAKTGELDIPGD